MITFLTRRIISFGLVLLGVIVITFFITHLAPADPAQLAAGLRATRDQVEQMKERMGLNDPLYVQFARYVAGLMRGDFGTSFYSGRPVIEDVILFLPATIELITVSTIIFVAIGIPLGIVVAVSRRRSIRIVANLVGISGMSLAPFWLALMLQLVFYGKLSWLPYGGRLSMAVDFDPITRFYLLDTLIRGNLEAFASSVIHMILPAVALAANRFGVTMRFVHSGMVEVLGEDYIKTARSKGLSQTVVVYKHALRNVLIPVVTMTGLQYGWLLAGAVYVESVFAWPGIGSYIVDSIREFDFMAVLAGTIVMSLIFTAVNLIVDITYGILDPRIRVE